MQQPRRHPPARTGSGAQDAAAAGHPRRGHLAVLYGLAAVLVAISLWCFVVLGRTETLRAELARHMEWLEAAGEVRTVLEPGMVPGNDSASSSPRPRPRSSSPVRRLLDASHRLVDGHASPELELAAQRLEQRLDDLAAQVELMERDGGALAGQSASDLEQMSYAVLTALPQLEAQVQGHVVELYAGLDRLWTSLRSLVLVCLLLCASNLGLLVLVHRRRMLLEEAHARAQQLTSHDALTGVWNRGAILRILRHELVRAERTGRPLGVLLLDLDDFGKLNVLIGSREADHVLREISHRLAAFVRPYDTFGRLGGNAFLVILPNCDTTATSGVADRLRQAVEEEVEHAHGKVVVRATLVHETIVHDTAASDATASDASATDETAAEAVATDPDLLVHGLQLRIDAHRRRHPATGQGSSNSQ